MCWARQNPAGTLPTPMKREGLLDVNEAVQNPGKHLTFAVTTELPEESEVELLDPVAGELDAVSTGNMLLVKAKLKTRCILECARCGEPLEVELSFRMEDEFPVDGIPSSYSAQGYAEVATDPEDDGLFVKNALVRDAYIRQGLLINIPVQSLCQYGWDGPCPKAAAAEAHLAERAQAGHPAMQTLEKFRQPGEEA
jgi:uncharacterized metal-binding protein YceD (DUF177 family)